MTIRRYFVFFGNELTGRRIVIAALLINVFVVVLICLSLRQSYVQSRERTEAVAGNLAQVLEQTLDGDIDKIDLILQAIADEFDRQQASGGLNGEVLQKFLDRQRERLSDVDTLMIADAQGSIVFGAPIVSLPSVSVADRDYFIRLRDEPANGLIFSKPLQGRVSSLWGIAFARRLSRADGSFAGIVCAVVSLERFVTKFSAFDVGTHGVVSLRNGDLALIARFPKFENAANSFGSLRPSRELERLARQYPKGGLYVARAKSDDIERIFSFRKLSDYNLYVVVGLATADSFADWRTEAVAMLCLAVIFAAMTLLAGSFLSRSWKARELALQEAEVATAQLGAILQNSPIGLAIIGIDRVIQLANKALGDIFGIPAERFQGRSSEVMLGSQVQFDELGRRAYPIILSGGTFEDEVSMHRQDGGVFWCKMRGRLLDPSVPSRGVVWVMEDSTEHKRNDQQLTLYRSLIEYTSDCVYVISPRQDFRMVFANDAACAHFGVSREELLTWCLPDWDIGLKDPDALDAFWDQVKREKSVLWQTRHRVHSNAVVPVEMSANYLQHGGTSFIAGYFHNIVARMTTERALVEKTQELARSNTDLEQFAYVASHDLREPLRMVGAYLALIEKRLSDHLTGETRDFIDFAKDGAERMDRLILDLLDYSRIGRVKRPFTPVALAEVMHEAEVNLKAIIDELGGNLEISAFLPAIAGDRQELVRLFQNLIGNAIKYHAADRPPKVKVGAHQRQGEWVITVADNGIGIAPPHFERIFGIFQRLHTRDDYEGTGIGLAICKKIVEHHKGTIWVRSTPGEGSEFFVSFPGAAHSGGTIMPSAAILS